MSESYRDLVAWQRAMDFVTEIYSCTASFPHTEMYGLTNQVRRASVSVPSNIAEGKGRRSKREYVQFLCRARGSLFEAETQIEIARNLGYLSSGAFDTLYEKAASVGRVLNGLIVAIERLVEAQHPRPKTRHLRPNGL